MPSEDKEKIRIGSWEKIREELKDKPIETNQDSLQTENISEDKNEKNDNNENHAVKDNNKQEYRDKVKSSFGIRRYKIQKLLNLGKLF